MTYLKAVRNCCDVLMDRGTDRYGSVHAPLLVSILDIESLNCPENPLPLDEAWRVIRRGRRNPASSNLLMDQVTIKTMYLLSQITGQSTYADFSNTYVDYYLKNLVDDRGLIWWGWHRCFDVFREARVGHNGDPHEFHASHCIAWENLWQINPNAVRREIEAIWTWHVCNKESGEINRHCDAKAGCDFSMTAGAFLYAFAFLYTKTGNGVWLDRARLLANYYWTRRNPNTDLFPDRPNAGLKRFDGGHFLTSNVGLHGHALLKTEELTGDVLFRNYAKAYLQAYHRYGYDAEAGKYWGSLTLDGTPVLGPRVYTDNIDSTAGYHASQPRGYLDLWQPYVCGYEHPLYAAQVYVYGFERTGEPAFLEAAKTFASWIAKELDHKMCMPNTWYKGYAETYAPHGTYADHYGHLISFFTHLFVQTNDGSYLALARRVADEAIEKLSHNGIFRGHPHKPYYEATDGVGYLMYGLLCLHLVSDPHAAIRKGSLYYQNMRVPLDNW